MKTKDDEIYEAWIENTHPAYLPFDAMTPWICKKLVEKYKDESMERPTWMNKRVKGDKNITNEAKFIKRIVSIYTWKGDHEDEVNEALSKFFGRNGEDLEMGADGLSLTFIKSKKSRRTLRSALRQVEPEI